MCDLVNFVLKCTGCDLQVDIHDIEDPDNAPNKLTDLQEEYQAQTITDYPLISRAKGNTFSRATMIGFFQSLVESAHATGVLYSDEALIENIQNWVITMSSSAIRPFRHTATVIALAISVGACNNMNELVASTATTVQQKEAEERAKRVNKGRVAALKAKVDENERKREAADELLKETFHAVFVHRYRDVDPKIRVECAGTLGTWITLCPDVFFEKGYLRYLGWLLSDISPAVRSEVVKQLLKLYKQGENLGRLRAFTEHFRARMVEMATQDAEANIRALAVELLDLIRELGLLEPDDVDTIGKLIFDTEPRVRKVIAPFFAANVKGAFEAFVEELGGEEALDESIGGDTDDDFEQPRKSWLVFKCLAEQLGSYDREQTEHGSPEPAMETLLASSGIESRYSLAAQVVCEGLEEAKEWEAIAGFLLHDFSSTSRKRTRDDPLAAFKAQCQLSEKEEQLLLDVLNASVRLRLAEAIESEPEKRGRKATARKDESKKIQEETALHLAKVIPLLLRKFGPSPSTASAVLRLEHILDLDIFQELRQDTTEFASLLDDINKQFSTHADRNVLAEASTALLHASAFEDLEDVTETKLQDLWEATLNDLARFSRSKQPQRENVSHTAHRIYRLSSISDCTNYFNRPLRGWAKPAIEIILSILQAYGGSTPLAPLDSTVVNLMGAVLCYYMWNVQSIKSKLEAKEEIEPVTYFGDVAAVLVQIGGADDPLGECRLAAVGTLIDLHILFITFRNMPSESSETSAAIRDLAKEIEPPGQRLILDSFVKAEKHFAKKARKTLEQAPDDGIADEPDSESEGASESEEDEEESQTQRAERRRGGVLLAEKRLCELTGKIVLGIVGGVLDSSGAAKGTLRKRLVRNKAKLGGNFKEVLNYLEEPKPKRSHRAKPKVQEKAAEHVKPPEKSSEVVDEDDESVEEIEEVEEGNDEDLRRRELQDGIEDESEREQAKEPEQQQEPEEDDEIMGD